MTVRFLGLPLPRRMYTKPPPGATVPLTWLFSPNLESFVYLTRSAKYCSASYLIHSVPSNLFESISLQPHHLNRYL